MSGILDTLPGLPMSVREVSQTVRHMWDAPAEEGHSPLSDYRASQMNLVLHFGAGTPPGEALDRFQQAIGFARVYPCRILVLAETDEGADSLRSLQGKLFSECYLGRDFRDLCCCEALMLSYPRSLAALVAHQVSLWLEADLPVYYWLHRVPSASLEEGFKPLLKQVQRIVHDRSVDDTAYAGLADVPAERHRDFAYARTLPLRQTLGQALSAVESGALVKDLEKVRIAACDAVRGEAAFLLEWIDGALRRCAREAGTEPGHTTALERLTGSDCRTLEMTWEYRGEAHLRWDYQAPERSGHIDASIGGVHLVQPIHIEPLGATPTLAETLFFD